MADQLALFPTPEPLIRAKKPRSEAQKRAWREFKSEYLDQEPYRTREFIDSALAGVVLVHRAGGMAIRYERSFDSEDGVFHLGAVVRWGNGRRLHGKASLRAEKLEVFER